MTTEMPDRWFYKLGDAKQGPVSTDQLRSMLQQQKLPVESRVWREGMESWLPAGEVPGLLPPGFLVHASDTALKADSGRSFLSPRLIIAGVAGLALVGTLLARPWQRRSDDPYAYRLVSGSVLYEDGQAIPSDVVNLTFIPLAAPISPRIYPRPGFAAVDPKTGAFQSATSRNPGDGLVQGGHKVVITGDNRRPLPEEIVPNEYADFKTTPLEIDTEEGQLTLRVKRPLPKITNGFKSTTQPASVLQK